MSRPTNRLAGESSPYLLQHAHNPVDWYPWGEEALARARAEDRPIFLSIGYSACHWCHVMERESFENEAIAERMNRDFVNIKVDREERPDLDQIYMAAVQAMTGQGGWPMSVFLTPDLQPFYGGTYFPPEDRRGMAGFPRVLSAVADAWQTRRDEIRASAARMTRPLSGLGVVAPSEESLGPDLLDHAFRSLSRAYEPTFGGFGTAPKFPHPMGLRFLLRQFARTGNVMALHMVRHTLDHMARGGIHDHLAGGFARYSTDDRWLVPHFEKMLYDNALLASTYLESYQVSGLTHDARVAASTLDYIVNGLGSPEGAFYATEDADSEGEEGKFYVWTESEIEAVLGPERARTFGLVYGVEPGGNWEGQTILNQPRPFEQSAKTLGLDPKTLSAHLAEDRAKLLAARNTRVRPGMDTKILASWNGLAIAALADAGPILHEPRYTEAAARAAGFILDHMRQDNGLLWHAYANGRARFNGYLDDSAAMIDGLTRLFEATGAERWVGAALELSGRMIDEFGDPASGGFFYTGQGHEALISRPKELIDSATPSSNALAATALLRLAALTGREDLAEAGRKTLGVLAPVIQQFPTAAGQALIALDFWVGTPREVALIAGADASEFRAAREAVARRFEPIQVVAPSPAGPASASLSTLLPLLSNRPAIDGRVTAYICRKFTCRAPLVGLEAIDAGASDPTTPKRAP
jgi:uncharacterized protein YyaL (SSP411 family)